MSFWQGHPADRLMADVSLWSANLACISRDIARIDPYADLYHIDVSDAHFTPNLLFFPDLVAALRPLTARPFHVHLMVERPAPLIEAFADAGADMISIHPLGAAATRDCLDAIGKRKCAAGLALGMTDDPSSVVPFLNTIEIVIMLGTEIGVKGKGVSPLAYGRLEKMKSILRETSCTDRIKVAADGGIRTETVPLLRKSGADLIVPGSLVFKSEDLAGTFTWIRSL